MSSQLPISHHISNPIASARMTHHLASHHISSHVGMQLLVASHLSHLVASRNNEAVLSHLMLTKGITSYLIVCHGAAHLTNVCRRRRQHVGRISSNLAHRSKVVGSSSKRILTTRLGTAPVLCLPDCRNNRFWASASG